MAAPTPSSSAESERPLEQFFRAVEQPSTPESLFTAQEVAEIIRRDRDAAN